MTSAVSVGAVDAQTAVLLHAAGWGSAEHGAADFSAGHRANSALLRCKDLVVGVYSLLEVNLLISAGLRHMLLIELVTTILLWAVAPHC